MLDFRGEGDYTNGDKIIQYPGGCGGDVGYLPSQWYFGFVLDGCDQRLSDCNLLQRMILVNAKTHKCLDPGNSAGGAPGQEAVLQQWDCISSINDWNAGNQLWTEEWAR
jgi:hypothetical protein